MQSIDFTLFQTMFFTKKGDNLHLSFHFVMQRNAPLLSTIIGVVLLCHFIFVTAPNPITVIIALSKNS